jgi:hypothetical protein
MCIDARPFRVRSLSVTSWGEPAVASVIRPTEWSVHCAESDLTSIGIDLADLDEFTDWRGEVQCWKGLE